MKLKAALIVGTGFAVLATAGAGAGLGAHNGACVIPKGSERVRARPGRLHHADYQPVVADEARQPVGLS